MSQQALDGGVGDPLRHRFPTSFSRALADSAAPQPAVQGLSPAGGWSLPPAHQQLDPAYISSSTSQGAHCGALKGGHAVRLRPEQLTPMCCLEQGQPSPPTSTQAKHMQSCQRFQPLVQWEVRPDLQAHCCYGSFRSILEHRSRSCPGFTP